MTGQELRLLLKARKWRKAEFAEECGRSVRQIERWFTLDEVPQFARSLAVRLEPKVIVLPVADEVLERQIERLVAEVAGD